MIIMRILFLFALVAIGALWSGAGSAGCPGFCNTSNASIVVEPPLACAGFTFHGSTVAGCGCDVSVSTRNDCLDESLEVCFGERKCEAVEPGETHYSRFSSPTASGRHTWSMDVTMVGVKHDVQVSADVEMISKGGCSANAALPRAGVPVAMLVCAMLLASGAGLRRRTRKFL